MSRPKTTGRSASESSRGAARLLRDQQQRALDLLDAMEQAANPDAEMQDAIDAVDPAPTGRHARGLSGSLPRAGVPATRNMQIKCTDAELAAYQRESSAAGDRDLSATVRRLFREAIARREARP